MFILSPENIQDLLVTFNPINPGLYENLFTLGGHMAPQLEPQGVYSNALKLVEDVGKGHSDLHIKPSNRASHQTLSKLSVNAEPTFVSLSKGQHGSF